MIVMDGKSLAEKIKEQIREEIAFSNEKVTLAVILVGDDAASQIYVKNKVKACEIAGIQSVELNFGADLGQDRLLEEIDKLNANDQVDGILVQLPLPQGYDSQAVINRVDPSKDVDALTYVNQGKLLNDVAFWEPCTPSGIILLLDEYGVELSGKRAVVIGRSILCGKPLAVMMTKRNATVTLAHSKTQNLSELTKQADIIAVCVGKSGFLKADMVKEGAVVIDVGINRKGNVISGDVDFESVAPLCSYITPVPGGVGPMTIATLLSNTLKAFRARKNK